MSSVASDWLLCRKPPEFSMHQPCCVSYHSKQDNKNYIIFTPWAQGFCYKLDIEQDIYDKIAEYPKYDETFNPRSPGQIINPITNELWVFGGHSDCFGKYDLINNKWQFIHKSDCHIPPDFAYPAYYFIPRPINQLHLFNSRLKHIKYDQSKQQFIECNNLSNKMPHCSYPTMAYIANKLLIMLTTEIWSSIIISAQQKEYEWNKCKITLPNTMDFRNTNKIIVAFNAVILIFTFNTQKMWFCDFGVFDENEFIYKWTQIDLPNLKTIKGYTYIAMDDNHIIHFFDIFGDYVHQTVPLSKLIPHTICEKYTDAVVYGYIKKYQNEINSSVQIPIDIIKLIVTFYL